MQKPTVIDIFLDKIFLRFLPKYITPNRITLFRLVFTPFVIFLLIKSLYFWGVIAFSIAALSDAADGALARTKNQITDWGKTFDPFADKILILGTAIIILPQFLDFYLLGAICIVELLLLANKFYLEHFKNFKIIQANLFGKIKMVLYCVGLGSILVYLAGGPDMFLWLSQTALYASLAPAIISLVVYRSI